MLMVSYKPSAFHGHKTLNLKYFGVTILILMAARSISCIYVFIHVCMYVTVRPKWNALVGL